MAGTTGNKRNNLSKGDFLEENEKIWDALETDAKSRKTDFVWEV